MASLPDNLPMSIVLSHRTARLFHDAPHRPRTLPALPSRKMSLSTGAPDPQLIKEARRLLASFGVPLEQLDTIDVIVSSPSDRRESKHVHCHVCTSAIPANSLIQIARGIFVCDVRLCALQAASYMSDERLIEYYFELCGRYLLPLDGRPIDRPDDYPSDLPRTTTGTQPEAHAGYIEIGTRTTTRALRTFFDSMKGACGSKGTRGSKGARRSIGYVLDGSRSPMETALMMTVVLPKRLGGLGLREVEMNHRVDVPSHLRKITRRRYFLLDGYIKRANIDLEYDGILHEAPGQRIIDEERNNVLRAMGFVVIRVTRQSMFDPIAFQRIMAAICMHGGIRRQRFPEGFQRKQEELRRFVTRRTRNGA